MKYSNPSLGFVTLIGLALITTSCQHQEDTSPAPHPVRGKVFYRDRPAVGATVMFTPIGDGPKVIRPTGVVEKDGTFRLTTSMTQDGAPTGAYLVTVIYPSRSGKADEEEEAGADILRGRFSDPKSTPLKAEVKPQDNEIEPFRLN